ncbi:MAG TPA: SUMF1/EgtB/PvdO family nonheme iron enzyme [Candidatus Acidoferrales bacterium]
MREAARQANSRQAILQRLAEAREVTDALFSVVRPEARYGRPIPERHRIVFYIGHLEAFDWNLLGRQVLGLESFHPEFDRLFAFGIDPVDGGLPTDRPADWPSLDEICAYNLRLRETLDAALSRASFETNQHLRDAWPLHILMEHRLMHAETLAYMFHQLDYSKKRPQVQRPEPPAADFASRMVDIPAGRATLGKPRGNGFGWDNEFEQLITEVPAFRIDACKVTNAQFLEFLRAGGYTDRALWSDVDWEWKEKNNVAHPAFWTQRGDQWFLRGMFEERPLPADWPAYVSHAEASAYARWRGLSLPSEAQLQHAAYGTPAGGEREYPWGNDAPTAQHGNFDFHRWDPVSVAAHPAGHSAFGVQGLVGNGWEWTSTIFRPLPGFERYPFYPGYSADFFDGKHYVIKGGSPRTAACMLRRTFRNWFQPRYPYVYAGFRCVEN